MAVNSGLFNSVNGDRKYNAFWFAQYFASFIGNGVFPNPSTGLQVVESTNMQTVVKAGKGWINGYYIVNDADYILQHNIADGVLKRIDRVIMRLNFLTRTIEIAIKKGVFASNPVAPTLQRDTDYHELALADVFIANGTTQIKQANITDLRLNKSLCGIVHGTVDQVDTTTIFNQYQSWFGDFTLEKQMDFDTWLESIKDILDGDVAANLANRISNLEGVVTTHLADSAAHGIGNKAALLTVNKTNLVSAINEAFQSASDGKTAVANAVTAKGVAASPADTFPTLATKIGQISTGKKWASGSITPSSGVNTINTLTFKPSIVLVTMRRSTIATFTLVITDFINFNTPNTAYKSFHAYMNGSGSNYSGGATLNDTDNYTTSNGFVFRGSPLAAVNGGSYLPTDWIAIE